MSPSPLPNLIAAAALAICFAGLGGTNAAAQSKSKLGTAEVVVKESGGSFVVLHQGREVGKFSARGGNTATLYCCTAGECSPIGGHDPSTVCDIVVNCGGQGCVPQ